MSKPSLEPSLEELFAKVLDPVGEYLRKGGKITVCPPSKAPVCVPVPPERGRRPEPKTWWERHPDAPRLMRP
jgi:hypothetical protein